MANIVNVRIQKRVVNAVIVTDLPCQVKNNVLISHQKLHCLLIPNIRDTDLDLVSDAHKRYRSKVTLLPLTVNVSRTRT